MSQDPDYLKAIRESNIRDLRYAEALGFLQGALTGGDINKIAQFLNQLEELHDEPPIADIIQELFVYNQSHNQEQFFHKLKQLLNPIPPAQGTPILFQGKNFAFTGVFTSCTRDIAEQATQQMGGRVQQSISAYTDYLIVGLKPHSAWKHHNRGNKIISAHKLLRSGRTQCKIINELDWANALINQQQKEPSHG